MTRSLILAATATALSMTAASAQQMISSGPNAYVAAAAPPIYSAPAWAPAYPAYVPPPALVTPPRYGPPYAIGYAAPYPIETYGYAAPYEELVAAWGQ